MRNGHVHRLTPVYFATAMQKETRFLVGNVIYPRTRIASLLCRCPQPSGEASWVVERQGFQRVRCWRAPHTTLTRLPSPKESHQWRASQKVQRLILRISPRCARCRCLCRIWFQISSKPSILERDYFKPVLLVQTTGFQRIRTVFPTSLCVMIGVP